MDGFFDEDSIERGHATKINRALQFGKHLDERIDIRERRIGAGVLRKRLMTLQKLLKEYFHRCQSS